MITMLSGTIGPKPTMTRSPALPLAGRWPDSG